VWKDRKKVGIHFIYILDKKIIIYIYIYTAKGKGQNPPNRKAKKRKPTNQNKINQKH
jgi:hypothetical protein